MQKMQHVVQNPKAQRIAEGNEGVKKSKKHTLCG